MIVSFAMTEAEFLAGLKTCTRRRWKPAHAHYWKAGTTHQAWSKIPYAKGARLIGTIRATHDAYLERLADMPIADLLAEGGMCATVEDFIRFVEGTPDERLYVARFEVIAFTDVEGRPGKVCACGKVIHLTQQLAIAERDRIVFDESREHRSRLARLHVYRCDRAGNWHVGHAPATGRWQQGSRAIARRKTLMTQDRRQEQK